MAQEYVGNGLHRRGSVVYRMGQLPNAQAVGQRPRLKHPADRARPDGRRRRDADDGDGSGVGAAEAEHHVDRRRLARAGRAEQGDGLAGRDDEVDAANRLYRAAGLGQGGGSDAGGLGADGRDLAILVGSARCRLGPSVTRPKRRLERPAGRRSPDRALLAAGDGLAERTEPRFGIAERVPEHAAAIAPRRVTDQ